MSSHPTYPTSSFVAQYFHQQTKKHMHRLPGMIQNVSDLHTWDFTRKPPQRILTE